MDNDVLKIAICNQKGGVGKSTITTLLASYLCYRKGYRVMIADSDYPQWSIHEQREREIILLEDNADFKAVLLDQFKRTKQKAYPIIRTEPVSAISDVKQYMGRNGDKFDLVFFDLPGTLNADGVIRTVAAMDHLFIPIKADRIVVESAIMFAKVIHEQLMRQGKSNIKTIGLFWSMVDRRERTRLFDVYEDVIGSFGLPILKTRLPVRSKFSKELETGNNGIYRSTLLAPDPAFIRDCQLDKLADEILSIIKLNRHGS